MSALALAAVPFVLHLFTRRKYTDVPFSAMIFLKQSKRRSLRRLTLHNILVLLCRAGAVAMLVLAFMMPIMQGRGLPWMGGRARVAVAVVIDNSYSMGREKRGVTTFERARDAAEKILSAAGQDDEILLFAPCGPLADRPLSSRDTGRRGLIQAIEKMNVSWCGDDVTGVVNRALFELESAGARDRRVVVISDMQQRALRGSVRRAGKDGAHLVFVDLGAPHAGADNISVESVSFPLFPLQGEPAPVCFTLSGGVQKARPVVTLHVNGRSRGEQSVSMEKNKTGRPAARGCFRPTFNSPGSYSGEVSIQNDALTADNHYFFTFEVYPEMGIVLVAAPADLSNPERDAYYLKRAIQTESGAGSPLRLETVAPGGLTGRVLSDARVVVVPAQTALDTGPSQVLRQFVSNGGGAFFISDGTATPGRLTDKLFFDGGTVLTSPAAGHTNAQGHFLNVKSFDATHALFSDYTPEKAKLLTATRFYKPASLTVTASGVNVLARLSDDRPLLVERRLDRGRVALLAAAVNPFASNLSLKTLFVPFVVKMLKHLGERGAVGARNFALDEPVELKFPDSVSHKKLVAKQQHGKTGEVTLESPPGAGGMLFRASVHPGVGLYEVYAPKGNKVLDRFAVNCDSAEGNLEKMSLKSIGKKFRGHRLKMFDASQYLPERDIVNWTYRKNFSFAWIPMVLGALALLFCDTLISNRK